MLPAIIVTRGYMQPKSLPGEYIYAAIIVTRGVYAAIIVTRGE